MFDLLPLSVDGTSIFQRSRRIRATARRIQTRSTLFIDSFDIDDVIAHLLVAEGFVSVEEIAESEMKT